MLLPQWKYIALVLGSMIVALLLAEWILRLTGSFATVGLHTVSEANYHHIPGMWEPNQDFINLEKPALPHHIRINSLGLRGPETTLEPRVLRVLCIGDSFTFGDFVDDEQTLPAQLGVRLGGQAEVLNGGIGGTTITDQRVLLERFLALRPHVVVLTFSENDLHDLFIDPPVHVQLARNRALKSGTLAPFFRLIRDTALFNALLRARAVLQTRNAQQHADPSPVPESAVQRYVSEMKIIRDLLAEKGIELIFAAYPAHLTVQGTSDADRIGVVLTMLQKTNISGIDLTLSLRDSGLPITELYLLPHDGHASPRGNSIAADALFPHVKRALERSSKKHNNKFNLQ